ncbi:Beta-1,3-galactosyltransferase 1 [Bulinus truncatus]|nr:Beta-1,3-galactosyltransferase 1 [Bulinus truncatus]
MLKYLRLESRFTCFVLFSVVMTGLVLTLLSMAKITHGKFLLTQSESNISNHYSMKAPDVKRLRNSVTKEVTSQGTRPEEFLKWPVSEYPELDKEPLLASVMSRLHLKLTHRKRRRINENNFSYIHNVPNACVGRKVQLVMAVPSRTNSFEARQAIRDTWGQYATSPTNNAVVLFFLGVQADRAGQEHIDAEALEYGDIVQEDFEDTYRNLSLKSIAIVKWVSVYCPGSVFVLKADDDMYINVPLLVDRLQKQIVFGSTFLLGGLHSNTSPFRDTKSKWYVTKDEFTDKFFPNYLSGTAYAMTTTAAMMLYIEYFYVKILYLEDVYLTGIVADQASVPRIADKDFSWTKYEASGCLFRYKVSGHKNSPEDIRKIHRELYDPNLRCSFL